MDLYSFDPVLFWPSTVIDLIFQHLKGKEILGASLVSTTWETFVGESQICMKKIEVKIIGRKYFLNFKHKELRKEIEMLSVSRRRYQNLTFYAQKPGFLTKDIIKLCQSRTERWKSIKIWSEKFTDEYEFKLFFHCFQENVESLDMRNLTIVKPSELQTKDMIEMKKLQVLRLSNLNNFQWLISSLKCSRLKLLEVENVCDKTLIRMIAVTTKTVKSLWISEEDWKCQFFDALSKLKSLELNEIRIRTLNARSESSWENSQVGFKKLLLSQAVNIRVLFFDVALNSDVLQTIFKLPKLKILSISAAPRDLFADSYPLSSSLIELRLKFICKFNHLWNIIKSTPNLKVLEVAVESNNKKVSDFVIFCLPRLEKLVLQE